MSRDLLAWNQSLQSYFKQGFHEKVLNLYRQLRCVGISPNASTFPSIIGSCSYLSDLQLGEQIHASLLQIGCKSDQYVVSSLINMYAKCQKIEIAQKLFEETSTRSVASWTALIQAYSRIGRSRQAFKMFGWMQQEDGIRPNGVTLISLIPACANLGDGEAMHGYAIKMGVDLDSFIGTSLVDMYLKFGAIRSGSQVFHGLEDKNEVSWIVMVSGLSQNGSIGYAVSIVETMFSELNMIIDSTSLVNLVSACARIGDLKLGMWAHTYIIKTGVGMDSFLGTALLNMYAKCGLLGHSHQVFLELPEQTLVSWNAIIHSHARLGLLEDVIIMFQQLIQAGFSPDSVTIKSCLLALASSSCYQRKSLLGECFHSLSVKYGFLDTEVETCNVVLDFYVKKGNLKYAEELFCWIGDRRDTISWNCLINGYAQNGYVKDALVLFSQMQLEHVDMDSFTLSIVLSACACLGDQSLGECIHGGLMKKNYTFFLTKDPFVVTALVDMYSKCGDVASAYRVFEEMHIKDTATWNAMASGFGLNGCFREVFTLFCDYLQVSEGPSVSEFAVGTAVSACGSLGCLEGGCCLHGFVMKNGLEMDINVENAILNMYSKCGALGDAELCFKEMEVKDTASWTTMISGYGVNGKVNDAVVLFEKMVEKNVEANRITFLELLWACSHGGMVKEGWAYFEKMRTLYGIEPQREHFCCLVDLLGRAGYLYEAYVLIRSMKAAPDAAIWGALLGACSSYGELELAQIASFELSRVDVNKKSSYFVLVSNAYAAGQLWEKAARVREDAMIDRTGTKKPTGWSQIEL
ncbi:putative pentatricopeptide repeat-containing protein At1g69350, mitochondrial [Aristolochia californica]|uniref:putative pentatricopeptide repeat-containing protein At1g69350, mitochondrial n=1 Tax=Aristolochia californica TaxID=171875 RepID=UPI0035DC9B98